MIDPTRANGERIRYTTYLPLRTVKSFEKHQVIEYGFELIFEEESPLVPTDSSRNTFEDEKVEVGLDSAQLLQSFHDVRHTLDVGMDLVIWLALRKFIPAEIGFIEAEMTITAQHHLMILAQSEQSVHLQGVPEQQELAGQEIMSHADEIVLIQHLIGNKISNVSEDNIDVTRDPRNRILSKDRQTGYHRSV